MKEKKRMVCSCDGSRINKSGHKAELLIAVGTWLCEEGEEGGVSVCRGYVR